MYHVYFTCSTTYICTMLYGSAALTGLIKRWQICNIDRKVKFLFVGGILDVDIQNVYV